MNLVDRAQNIVLRPKATWPVIDAESADGASLYKNYLMILALVPALAGFIGLSLVGVGAFGFNVRVPILSGLVSMVLRYLLSLGMTFVLALIVEALAPTFGGVKSRISALKLVVYASTAAMLGGIFSLLPVLGVLGLIAGLYSLYLLFVGLPVLMKCPPEKALAYTAVVTVCAIVAAIIVGAISAALIPTGLLAGRMAAPSRVAITTPDGTIAIDTARMEEAARRMEEASRRIAAAPPASPIDKAASSPEGVVNAASNAVAAMTGGDVKPIAAPIPPAQLKALLPGTAANLPRVSIESQSGTAMGMGGSSAKAVYQQGDRSLELSINDASVGGGLALAGALSSITLDRDTADDVEKVFREGSRTVHEDYRKDGSHTEYMLILANGVMVKADADGVGIDDVKKAVQALDITAIEAMKHPPSK